MSDQRETVSGYVVDVACVRKYPKSEMVERGRGHTRDCALMHHCIESGYVLIDSNGGMILIENEATGKVVEAIRGASRDRGIILEAERVMSDGEMKTLVVRELGHKQKE